MLAFCSHPKRSLRRSAVAALVGFGKAKLSMSEEEAKVG